MTEPEGIRLQKVLAAAGVASRRASRRATVDLPEPLPPVSPTRSTRSPRGTLSLPMPATAVRRRRIRSASSTMSRRSTSATAWGAMTFEGGTWTKPMTGRSASGRWDAESSAA